MQGQFVTESALSGLVSTGHRRLGLMPSASHHSILRSILVILLRDNVSVFFPVLC
jgi:hypothetical protein